MTNVLITSVGTRNKIIQYFKENSKEEGKVIATDMSKLAPAIYEADAYYIVPRITDSNYIDIIFDICKKEKIDGILSLIDPELSLLAKNEKKFKEIGVTVVGSPVECCELSLDKMNMYQWLKEHDYNCAKSYLDKNDFYKDLENGDIYFPVFVKPHDGSASILINKVDSKKQVDLLFEEHDGLMIQEFLNGQEIGADVYIDLISGEVVSIFTKKKLLMRAGETDKSISFKDERLFELIEKFVKEAGFRGQIDIDIFDVDGEYYISEVNPRFGGGYPHAYECGVNNMKLILNNLNNIKNKKDISYEDGVYMMKYNEVSIIGLENI
ncbi:ATP-grasp domain-containing protein [Anaerococcus sp.]|uniref:ATP-grasp domain-containing protein n=1 Tax=Anaerococcus sp. TaxID=1872515 RepID=UPI0025857BD4|nr:ATP-grasp domain-containing protein [Anaerococcus sp.]MDU3212201.1 ATP-grasp domain-containing protein [Anaerococcus sp.]